MQSIDKRLTRLNPVIAKGLADLPQCKYTGAVAYMMPNGYINKKVMKRVLLSELCAEAISTISKIMTEHPSSTMIRLEVTPVGSIDTTEIFLEI